MPDTVVVGWVDGGNTRGEWAEAVSKLVAYETWRNNLVSVVRVHSGPQMEEGRNLLVERFLETDAEWLFMVDTDMVFDHDAVERLLATAAAQDVLMVGGLCFGINTEFGQFPTMYRTIDGMPHVLFGELDGVVPVDATGAAFTLTHRSLFEDHRREGPHPWFHRKEIAATDVHPGGILGEDLSWCWHLRSEGVAIMVDTSVEAGQIKPSTVGTRSYEMMRATD
jgi:hypothetical protein